LTAKKKLFFSCSYEKEKQKNSLLLHEKEKSRCVLRIEDEVVLRETSRPDIITESSLLAT
jgi:hypothetical protein